MKKKKNHFYVLKNLLDSQTALLRKSVILHLLHNTFLFLSLKTNNLTIHNLLPQEKLHIILLDVQWSPAILLPLYRHPRLSPRNCQERISPTIYKTLHIPGWRQYYFQNVAWCNACISFPGFLLFKNPKKKFNKS